MTHSNRCSSLKLGLAMKLESHFIFIIYLMDNLESTKRFNLNNV